MYRFSAFSSGPVNAATKLNEGKIQNEFCIGANLQRNCVSGARIIRCLVFNLKQNYRSRTVTKK